MAFEEKIELLEKEVRGLKKELLGVKGSTGGILSGGDIRNRILTGSDADTYLKFFKNRQWEDISDWWKKQKGKDSNEWEKLFVIREYNEVNVTPFSYDLSLGNQVFSIQQPQKGVKPLEGSPYELQPSETVVVITEEEVAIPHAYSATVWPRFNMVRQGVFQSMVKIDPTWHGKLAVAISNLSPAIVNLNHGDVFATLLFCELSKESDVDLWKLKDLQNLIDVDAEVEIPSEFRNEIVRIENHIFKEKIRGYCRVNNKSLIARGIKRDHVEKLKRCFVANQRWHEFIDLLAEQWTKKTYGRPGFEKRMIVMNALGMNNLWDIVKGLSMEGYLKKGDILDLAMDDDSLTEAAVKYGRPFNLFARVPDIVIKRIEDGTIPKIEAEIQSNIQTRVILLVFSLFGFISLTLTILVMLWRLGGKDFLETFSNWDGLWAVVTIGGSVFGLGFLFVASRWLKSATRSLGQKQKEISQRRQDVNKSEENLKNEKEVLGKEKELLKEEFEKLRKKQAKSIRRFRKHIKKN